MVDISTYYIRPPGVRNTPDVGFVVRMFNKYPELKKVIPR